MQDSIRILDLCSGTGSIAKWAAKQERPIEVTSVDLRSVGDYTPTHIADLLTFPYQEHFQPGHFHWVHASPSCTQYSLARVKAKTPRDLEGADRLVAKCIEVMLHCDPDLWTLENPRALLHKRDVVGGLPCFTVDYCAYGTMWKKPTNIWTNLATWTPKRCHALCPAFIPGTRLHQQQMSGTKSMMGIHQVQVSADPYLKGKLPEPLLQELFSCASREFGWAQ